MTRVRVFGQPEHEISRFAPFSTNSIPPKSLKSKWVQLSANLQLTTNGLTKSSFEVYAAR